MANSYYSRSSLKSASSRRRNISASSFTEEDQHLKSFHNSSRRIRSTRSSGRYHTQKERFRFLPKYVEIQEEIAHEVRKKKNILQSLDVQVNLQSVLNHNFVGTHYHLFAAKRVFIDWSKEITNPPLVVKDNITSRDKRDYARELHATFTSEHGLSFEEITCDEVDDMLPKTDYTYAKTESYSPKYSGERYISPNMSRRRLRSSQPAFLSDDEEEFSRYENDHVATSNNRVYSHHSQTTESETESSTVGSQKFGISRLPNVMTSTPVVVPYNLHHISTNDRYYEGILLRSGSHLKGSQRYSRGYMSNSHAVNSEEAVHSDLAVHSNEAVHYDAISNSAYRSDVDVALQHQSRARNNIVTETTTTTTTTTSNLHPKARKDQKQTSAFTVDDHSETKLRLDESQTEKEQNKQEYKLNHLFGLDYEEEISDVDDMTGWDKSAVKHKDHSQREFMSISYMTTVFTTVITSFITAVTSTFSDDSTSFVKPLSVAASKFVVAPGRWLLESMAAWASWLITMSATLLLWDIDVKQKRRRGCCCCLLPLLFLLPLLLLGGYYTRGLRESVGAYLSDAKQAPSWAWSNLWFTHSSSEHESFSANSRPAATPTSVPFQTSNSEAAHQMNMTQIYEFILQMNAASAASSSEKGQLGLTKEQVETIVKGLLASSVHEITTTMQGQVETLKILLQGDITSLQQKVTGLEAEIRTVVGAHQVLTDKLNQASGSFDGFAGQKAGWLAASETLQHQLLNLTEEVNHLSSQYASLSSNLVNCCRNSSDLDGIVRAHVFSVLSQMSTDKDSPLASLVAQMGHNYVDKDEMENRLSAITLEVIKNVKVTLARTEEKSDTADVQQPIIGSLNESAVKLIVEEALNQFSADRVGMADFALESAGGSVISVRCSETYYKKTALVSIFGFPLWYTSNSPRTVIQPDVHPGECWAFKGQTGYIVFQLSLPIEPTGFTLEHIPRSLTPTGDISSAPKEFTVFGLMSESDTQGVSLGNYTYEDNGIPIQHFPVQNAGKGIFQLVELRILGNHGNTDYTCIYRFRVHGKP